MGMFLFFRLIYKDGSGFNGHLTALWLVTVIQYCLQMHKMVKNKFFGNSCAYSMGVLEFLAYIPNTLCIRIVLDLTAT